MRQHELHGIDDVWRGLHQPLALAQRLRHQLEFIIFQIAQAAMDQLGRGRGGVARQVVAFDQQHFQPQQRRLARNRRAVDAAADDEQVICHRCRIVAAADSVHGENHWPDWAARRMRL